MFRKNIFTAAISFIVFLAVTSVSAQTKMEILQPEVSIQTLSPEQAAWLTEAQGVMAETPIWSMGRTPMEKIRVYANEPVVGGWLALTRRLVINQRVQAPELMAAWYVGLGPEGFSLEADIPSLLIRGERGMPVRFTGTTVSTFHLFWLGNDGRTSTADIDPTKFAAMGYVLVPTQAKAGYQSTLRLGFTPGMAEEPFSASVNGSVIKARTPDFEVGNVTFNEVREASLYIIQLKSGLCAYQWVQ